jgi:DNA topoisomerase-3
MLHTDANSTIQGDDLSSRGTQGNQLWYVKPMYTTVRTQIELVFTGTCQFPTLGFVVDRYFRVRNFSPETFWKLQVIHKRDGISVNFNWKRVHLFDRMIATILFERCILAKTAKVTKINTRPTSKWKPLPLTTVELQKCGSRFLRLNSQRIMKV